MDGADTNVQTVLQAGIQAAQAKRKQEAYHLLSQVVRGDPQSEQGWLWLAAVAPSPQESLEAFEHVLTINPHNEQARVGRRWAMSRAESASAARTAPSRPPSVAAGAAAATRPPGPPTTPLGPLPAPGGEPGRPGGAEGGGLPSDSLLGVFAPAAAGAVGAGSAAPPPARPDAGTPGGAPAPGAGDWRASSELSAAPASVNWDDDGVELGRWTAGAGTPAPPPAQNLQYAPAARPPHADPLEWALAEPAVVAVPAEPPAPEPEPGRPALTPVGRRASILPLVLGLILMLAGLLVLILGWNSLNASNQFSATGERFFQAQLQPDYRTAAGLLVPDLQTKYATSNDLADIKLAAALTGLARPVKVLAAPLATTRDNKVAESVVTLVPASGPALRYLVHLSNASDKWLIDQILPYPASAGAGAAP